jgi:hypothetical protein
LSKFRYGSDLSTHPGPDASLYKICINLLNQDVFPPKNGLCNLFVKKRRYVLYFNLFLHSNCLR